MGITGLKPFLYKSSPRGIQKFAFREELLKLLTNKTVAIDMTGIAFRLNCVTPSGTPDELFVAIVGFLELLAYWSVSPLVVLDGKDKVLKAETQAKRRARAPEDARWLTKDHVKSVESAVQSCDLDVFHAQGDGEQLCAWLAIHRYADVVVSDDTDSLVFGAPFVVFNMTTAQPEMACLELVLDDLNVTLRQFQDACMMIGCDFAPKLHRVGPVRAFKLIRGGPDIWSVLETMKETEDVCQFAERYPAALSLFRTSSADSWTWDSHKLMSATPIDTLEEPADTELDAFIEECEAVGEVAGVDATFVSSAIEGRVAYRRFEHGKPSANHRKAYFDTLVEIVESLDDNSLILVLDLTKLSGRDLLRSEMRLFVRDHLRFQETHKELFERKTFGVIVLTSVFVIRQLLGKIFERTVSHAKRECVADMKKAGEIITDWKSLTA